MHSSQHHVSQNAPKMHVFRDILSDISTVNRLSWYIHYGACVGSHVITWVRLIRCNSPYSTTLGCWWRQWRWRCTWRGYFYAVRIGSPPAWPAARGTSVALGSPARLFARWLHALRYLCLDAAVGLPARPAPPPCCEWQYPHAYAWQQRPWHCGQCAAGGMLVGNHVHVRM